MTGGDRAQYQAQIWEMYQETYRRIGMSISSAAELLRYPVWEVERGSDGGIVAFNVFKTTSFGLKSALIGHDGSPEGKSAAVHGMRTKFKQSGVYGEVSHKVRDIVLSAGAPVVCSNQASAILGKPTTATGPITYTRSLSGVGVVEKTLVGRPRGVETTSARNPYCPIGDQQVAASFEDDTCDLDSHYCDLMISSLM